MENFLTKSFLAAACILALWWMAFKHLSDQGVILFETLDAPVTKRDIATSGPMSVHEPPIAKRGIIPGIEFPKTWWTNKRLIETTDSGVRVIPKGTRITILEMTGEYVSVTDGRVTLLVPITSITCDVAEISKLTR